MTLPWPGDAIPATAAPPTGGSRPGAAARRGRDGAELLGVRPPVWRRLLVPATGTLRELHGVVQVAFGWEGIHLFQFCRRDRRRLGSG